MCRVRILDRYILGEIVTPFFLSIAALTLVLFLQKIFRLAELVATKGAGVGATAAILGYVLPGFLVLTIPMSFLVATLTAFARMGADSEITAMKASRISLYNMLRPVMIFAVLVFLATASLSLFIAPGANHALKVHLFNLVKSRALIGVEPGVFSSTFSGMVVYVDKMETVDDMEGIFISDEKTAKEPYAIVAKRGRLLADPASLNVTLAMRSGSIHMLPRDEENYSTMSFESGNLYLNIGNALVAGGPGGLEYDEVGSAELYRELKRARSAGKPTREMESELQKRVSLPFACLLFGLIGAPLGMRRTRSGKSAGIIVALLVFLVYYVLLASGTNLSNSGKLPPLVAYWLPNMVMTAGAVLLVVTKGQERELPLGKFIVDGWYRLRRSGKKGA